MNKRAEKYVEIFFSIFTGLSLSSHTSTHVLGKPQGREFYLFTVLCDGFLPVELRGITSCAFHAALQAVLPHQTSMGNSTHRTYILSTCQVPREVPILVHHALGQLLEIPCWFFRPPVHEVSVLIKIPACNSTLNRIIYARRGGLVHWGGERGRLWIVLLGEQYCKASEMQTWWYIWKFMSLWCAPWKHQALKHVEQLALSVLSLAAPCLTVVVKAVCDLMPDDHSYAAVIQGFGLRGTEERGLQNARREDCKESHSTVMALPRYPAATVGPEHFDGLQQKPPCSLGSPHSNKWLAHGNAVGQEEQGSRTAPLFRHFQNHEQLLLCYYFALQEKAVLFQFTSLSIHRLLSHH